MAVNYTPIPTGSAVAATAEAINSRLQELDDAIQNMKLGTAAGSFTQLNIGEDGTTLVIDASGVISVSQSKHAIDTNGGAASDNLSTISGSVDGDILFFHTVSAARVVTVDQTGNVYSPNGGSIVLDDPKIWCMALRDGTNAKWMVFPISTPGFRTVDDTTPDDLRNLILPKGVLLSGPDISSPFTKRLAVMPDLEVINRYQVRAAAATFQADGIAAPTVLNTPVNVNDNDLTMCSLPSTAVLNQLAGMISPTFNLHRIDHDPEFVWIGKTPADISTLRYWIGLTSAEVSAVDTLVVTNFVGFRWSTVAGDTGWRAITKDSGGQNAGVVASAQVLASTQYKLRLRVDSAAQIVYFSVNDGAEVSINANIPDSGAELGFCVRVIPSAAAIRQINMSRLICKFK